MNNISFVILYRFFVFFIVCICDDYKPHWLNLLIEFEELYKLHASVLILILLFQFVFTTYKLIWIKYV